MAQDTTSVVIQEDSLAKETLRTLNQMRVQRELCDIILLVNGTEIVTHRAILAACSPYFRAMFLSGFIEALQPRVVLKDVDTIAFMKIIDFFYTSELRIHVTDVEAILNIACLLHLDYIIEECEKLLRRNITPGNCLGLKTVAQTYSLNFLYKQAWRFSLWHFGSVVKEDEFLRLPPDDLQLLVSDDLLKVKDECEVVNAVWQWLKYDFANRCTVVTEILQHIRFPLMNIADIMHNVHVKEFCQNYTLCRQLVREAIRYNSTPRRPIHDSNPRLKPRMASEDIYVIGGWSNGQKMSTVQCFNVNTLQWTCMSGMTIATVAKEDYFRVVVVDEELFTVSRNKVGKFDPILNCWITIANGPDVQCKWAGVCHLNGLIYVVGGHSSMCAKSFNPETCMWTDLPSMKCARYYPGVAVLSGKIYAVGGLDHLWSPLKTAERYDPATNQWELISSMGTPRWSLGVAVVNKLLYAIGGSDAKELWANSVEVYDLLRDKWIQNVTPMNEGRRCLGVAVVNNNIYVVGGRVVNTIEFYDRKKNQWKIVGSVNSQCNFGCVALRPI